MQTSKLVHSFVLALFMMCIVGMAKHTFASFSTVSVLMHHTKVDSPISALICAQPQNVESEGKVTISFPAQFQINQNRNNWIISTENLPDGTTAWLGIGQNPTSISGNTVTFSSGDIAISDLSCFKVSSSDSRIKGTDGTSVRGTITTYTPFNFELSSSPFFVPIGNDSVKVTAQVPADPKDYSTQLYVITGTSPYPENSEIEFEIRYRGDFPFDPRKYRVQAEWTQGVIDGPGSSVELVEYVIGSATNAYGNTEPIIDPINRTITWTIDQELPRGKTYAVNFKLRIKRAYTGPQKVKFNVIGRALLSNTQTPDSKAELFYQFSRYNPNVIQPATPASLSDVEIVALSSTEATIRARTSKISKSVTIRYGTKPRQLSKSVTDAFLSQNHELTLKELLPNTVYYFRLYSIDEDNLTTESDLYTFKTSHLSLTPKIDPSTFLITSANNVLISPATLSEGTQLPTVIVPLNTPYEIRFRLSEGSLIKNIQMITRDNSVLGVATADGFLGTDATDMAEIIPGIFTGRLLSKEKIGEYLQMVKIFDHHGNIIETAIAKVRVVPYLTVLEKTSKKGVENAKVKVSLFNPTLKIFEEITGNQLPIKNPSYTFPNGTANLVLPPGRYSVEAAAIGYGTTTQEFTVGLFPNDGYPTLHLERKPFSIIDITSYYLDMAGDFTANIFSSVRDIQISNRSFHFLILLVLGLCVVATYFSFHIKTHNPFLNIFAHLPFLHPKTSVLYVGKVVDENKKALSRVQIFLVDENNHTISNTFSNKVGTFHFRAPEQHYSYLMIKNGYEPVTIPAGTYKEPQVLALVKTHSISHSFRDYVIFGFEKTAGGLFEFLLLLSLVCELLFIQTFGLTVIAPFMIITFITYLLWANYLRSEKKIGG